MNITKGKIARAQKVVFYGPEGIGKSTFASQFPDPLFIDTEGSTSNMDVARLDKPTSWIMLKQQIDFVKQTKPCKTLVIDTIDWAEQLCIDYICSQHSKTGIEDFGYGNGYVFVKEELGRFLNLLSDVVDVGINVILTAHAQIRKFEQPDEMGAYDRYELKLGKKTASQTAPLVKEWADMVLFGNYKTLVVATDKEGKKNKGQGGMRVIYTEHHPAWDAKNRHGLPPEIPLDYRAIAHIFTEQQQQTPAPITQTQQTEMQSAVQKIADAAPNNQAQTTPQDFTRTESQVLPEVLPQALKDLMTQVGMTFEELVGIAFMRGHFPQGTPPESFPQDYYQGAVIANWEKMLEYLKEYREKQGLPF